MLEICEQYFEINFSTQRSMDKNWEFIHKTSRNWYKKLVPKKTIGTVAISIHPLEQFEDR